MTTFEVGDKVIWYDARLWGPRDLNNNEHCYKPGTVVGVSTSHGDPTIDILFDHNPNVSHGHFIAYPYRCKVVSLKQRGA